MKTKLTTLISFLFVSTIPVNAQQLPTCAIAQANRLVVYAHDVSDRQLSAIQQKYPSARRCLGFDEPQPVWVQVAQARNTEDVIGVKVFLSNHQINFDVYFVDRYFGYWKR